LAYPLYTLLGTVRFNMDILEVFIKRMKKLNIEIELVGNYPWIYIDKINGKNVVEKFEGNHGFTIAFLPIRKEQKMKFTDIGEIFRLVRKYCA
jgi:hypothetical protein